MLYARVGFGSLGVYPTTSVILVGTSPPCGGLDFGKPFLLHNRSGHFPRPCFKAVGSLLNVSVGAQLGEFENGIGQK